MSNQERVATKGGDGDESDWANDVTASCMYVLRASML